MKIILSITLLMLFFIGCSKNQVVVKAPEPVVYEELYISYESKLEQLAYSLENWNTLKDSRGTTYQYTRKSSSSWGGIKSETTIKVQDDFVISRVYYVINDENVITSSWREEGFDALNDNNEGAPTKRMDDLYIECKTILESESDVSLSFDFNGVLSQCRYGKKGIMIENFVFLY